ncbi:DUF1097 domain-containing protein [Lachnospiraceae bacterium 56-18]
MSKKAIVIWGCWVGLLAAISNWLMSLVPTSKNLCNGAGAPWILFVVLAAFALSGYKPQDAHKAIGSMLCGTIWGQVDMVLMLVSGFDLVHGFLAITVGTALAIIVHLCFFKKCFFSVIPFIFVGVCLTFGTGAHFSANPLGILGLAINLVSGAVLSVLVIGMELYLVEKMPEKSIGNRKERP